MIDNEKYIQKTKSNRYAVIFPRGIKCPRRLGTYDSLERAIAERDDFLSSKGKEIQEDTSTELSTVDKLPIFDVAASCVVGLYDLHVPYHHEKALSVAKQIIKDLNPDCLFFGGDSIDFFQLSTFLKDTSRAKNIQDELDTWYNVASEIVSVCDAKVYHIPGNHEARLYRYLCANPELSSLRALQLDSLLRLDDLRARQAKALRFLDKSLVAIHGRYFSSISGSAAKKEMKQRGWQQSVIQGHGHRCGYFEINGPLRRIEGHEIGCLCQNAWYTSDELVWQRGFVVITIQEGRFSVENVRVDNGKAIFRGNVYKE